MHSTIKEEINIDQSEVEMSNASVLASKKCGNCSKSLILCIFFMVLAVFFAIYGCTIYAVPVSRYNNNKKNHPDISYFKVPVSFTIIHWIFVVVSVVVMSVCAALAFKKNYCILFGILPFFGILWIAYGCIAGLSNIYKAAGQIKDLDYFLEYSNSTQFNLPYIEFEGTASRRDYHYDLDGSCTMSDFRVYATSWTDDTSIFNIPNQSEMALIQTVVHLDLQNLEIVENIKKQILYRLNTQCSSAYSRTCLSWSVETKYRVDNMKDLIFVSMNGKVQAKFKKPIRILSAIFWAGAGYAYDLAGSSSYYSFPVVKENVVLTQNVDYDSIARKCQI